MAPVEDMDGRIARALTADEILRKRRGKTYDLRPLIESLERLPESQDQLQRLYIKLSARPGATGRPDEVLRALGIAETDAQIHRTRLLFDED